MDHLAEALVDHLNRTRQELSSRQLEGMERLKYTGSWNLCELQDIRDLEKFFLIFDDIFFNGVLQGYCSLAYKENGELEDLPFIARCLNYGGGLCDCHPLDGRQCMLEFVKTKDKDLYFTTCLRDIFGSLLHEMTHALFAIYSCTCGNGCANRLLEWRGHHAPWLKASYAIEQATKRFKAANGSGSICFPLGRMSLDRHNAFAHAVYNGVSIPIEQELRRLHLDIEDLLWLIRWLRKCGAEQRLSEAKAAICERNSDKRNLCIARAQVFVGP